MKGDLSKINFINAGFNNFDQFSEAVKLWNLDFRQLDSGDFNAEVVQTSSPNWQIGRANFNRKLDQSGQSPPALRTFAVLLDNSPDIIWHGRDTNKDNVMIFPDDCELDSQSLPGFGVQTLSFKEDILIEVQDTLGQGEYSDILKQAEVVSCNPESVLAVHNVVNNLISGLKHNAEMMTEDQVLYEIEYEIPRALILALTEESPKDKKPDPTERYLVVKRVKEYIEDASFNKISVRDLCRAAFCSERTLRYAFNEYFGISPKAFVKMIRLNRVRRDLRRYSPQEKNITDIANMWGFWHMGQFARDYKKLFGELPSETER